VSWAQVLPVKNNYYVSLCQASITGQFNQEQFPGPLQVGIDVAGDGRNGMNQVVTVNDEVSKLMTQGFRFL